MNRILDTLVWLLGVPVGNGFVMIFLAIFGGLGALVLYLATGREKGRPLPGSIIVSKLLTTTPVPLLADARQRAQLPRATPPPSRRPRPARIATGALVILLIAGGVLGLLGIIGVPVTHAYIYDHGVETEARMDGEWVSFTVADGTEYTVRNDFFSAATYPGSDPTIGYGDEPMHVRYLETHPQAFVVVVGEQ